MKVLFLGAGASRAAGYPLASQLLEEVKMYVEASRISGVSKEWGHFSDFIKETEGVPRHIFTSSNPEIVLTLLDLFSATRAADEQDSFESLRHAKNTSGRKNAVGKLERFQSAPDEFSRVELARLGLRRSLDEYFWQKHAEDGEDGAMERRAYLEQELSRLGDGDVVITTNWDTLVERILWDTGRWSPADGYGFPVRLIVKHTGSPLASVLPHTSEVKVLKLHGSFGWYRRQGGVYLGESRYFLHLPLRSNGGVVFLKDASEPDLVPDPEAAFLYPSFVKQLLLPELQDVWSEATAKLAECEAFRAIGYSLPESDAGVRALLISLKARRRKARRCQKKISIVVKDPEKRVYERWQALLGEDIKWDPAPVGGGKEEMGRDQGGARAG